MKIGVFQHQLIEADHRVVYGNESKWPSFTNSQHVTAETPFRWFCDHCRRWGTSDGKMWHCRAGCKYDLCDKCYSDPSVDTSADRCEAVIVALALMLWKRALSYPMRLGFRAWHYNWRFSVLAPKVFALWVHDVLWRCVFRWFRNMDDAKRAAGLPLSSKPFKSNSTSAVGAKWRYDGPEGPKQKKEIAVKVDLSSLK